ncbi:carboxypeptidase-like regulatory domain-containing protein, partial [bacterium]
MHVLPARRSHFLVPSEPSKGRTSNQKSGPATHQCERDSHSFHAPSHCMERVLFCHTLLGSRERKRMKTTFTLYRNWRRIASGLLVVSLIALQSALAQGSGSIKGHVYDKTSGEALPGANLVIKGTSLGSATAFDGSYAIRNIPAGPRQLKVSYVGYAGLQ